MPIGRESEEVESVNVETAGQDEVLHLRAGGVSLVVDVRGGGLPRVVHWGADLGALAAGELHELATASLPPRVSNVPDGAVPLGLLPEHARGWPGTPGLSGHRGGRAWSPLFAVTEVRLDPTGRRLRVRGLDAAGGLGILLEMELTDEGVLRLRGTVSNDD